MLQAGIARDAMDEAQQSCVARYERPDARWRAASTVARSGGAAAAMDLSDGLADAARQMAASSGLGVTVNAAAIPLDRAVVEWSNARGMSPVDFSLVGGDDYELAFAVSPRRRSRFLQAMRRHSGVAVACVGRFIAGSGAWLQRGDSREPMPDGFSHF
jgi:thiamine-monophosphate kinase